MPKISRVVEGPCVSTNIWVVVAIVLRHFHKFVDTASAPRHQLILFRVHLEENLQDGNQNGEGKDIENGCQHIHAERADDVTFVAGKVLAHLLVEFFH